MLLRFPQMLKYIFVFLKKSKWLEKVCKVMQRHRISNSKPFTRKSWNFSFSSPIMSSMILCLQAIKSILNTCKKVSYNLRDNKHCRQNNCTMRSQYSGSAFLAPRETWCYSATQKSAPCYELCLLSNNVAGALSGWAFYALPSALAENDTGR